MIIIDIILINYIMCIYVYTLPITYYNLIYTLCTSAKLATT